MQVPGANDLRTDRGSDRDNVMLLAKTGLEIAGRRGRIRHIREQDLGSPRVPRTRDAQAIITHLTDLGLSFDPEHPVPSIDEVREGETFAGGSTSLRAEPPGQNRIRQEHLEPALVACADHPTRTR